MTGWVKVIESVPVVSTLDMWEGLESTHHQMMALVGKYKSEMAELGTLDFRNLKSGGKPIQYCFLNEEQTTFLITLMRNSKPVVRFKLRLTKEFYRQKKILFQLAPQQQNVPMVYRRF